MSIAFHFHLDPNKPDEARALTLLNEWQQAGWSLQKIIVMALLVLNASQSKPSADLSPAAENGALDDIRNMLEDMRLNSADVYQLLYDLQDRLNQLETMSFRLDEYDMSPSAEDANTEPAKQQLTDEFLSSLKKNRKPGIHIED